jgi:hypothetical protein
MMDDSKMISQYNQNKIIISNQNDKKIPARLNGAGIG